MLQDKLEQPAEGGREKKKKKISKLVKYFDSHQRTRACMHPAQLRGGALFACHFGKYIQVAYAARLTNKVSEKLATEGEPVHK